MSISSVKQSNIPLKAGRKNHYLPKTNQANHVFFKVGKNKLKKPKSRVRLLGDSKNNFLTNHRSLSPCQNMNPLYCSIHNKKLDVFCLDCNIMICSSCALFGDHKVSRGGYSALDSPNIWSILAEFVVILD